MKWWSFQDVLIQGKWNGPTFFKINERGEIEKIQHVPPADRIEKVKGFLIPGFRNAHSHIFQYLMAGLSEYRARKGDDFWSWRKHMYNFANRIQPDHLESIAAMAYAEMLKFGFTSVAEFHYLHHDDKGTPFENISEMSVRILNGAKKAGINITLLPVFYQRADFGQPALSTQRRFISKNLEQYLRLLEAVRKDVQKNSLFHYGVCVHSLRAVAGEDVISVFKWTPQEIPAHIHIAEQKKEVEASLAFNKMPPVQWLMQNVSLNERYNLVHATHMTERETISLAKTKAHVVICPSTEGNLGDGFFNLLTFHKNKGSFSIGTDGHFNLNPLEEYRLLDYGQRLLYRKRNLICLKTNEESGQVLYLKSLKAGDAAMGKKSLPLAVGSYLDGVVLDPNHPCIFGLPSKKILSALIFSADPSVFQGTIIRGKWVVRNGRHLKYPQIFKDFSKVKLEIIK